MQKAALALFGFVLAGTLIAPPKAAAQIHIGVRIGSPEPYGEVVVQPAPYVVYDEPYFVEHNWDSDITMATTMATAVGIEEMIVDIDTMTKGSDKQDMTGIVAKDIGKEIGKAEIMGVMKRDAVGILGVIEITGMMGKDAIEIMGMKITNTQ